MNVQANKSLSAFDSIGLCWWKFDQRYARCFIAYPSVWPTESVLCDSCVKIHWQSILRLAKIKYLGFFIRVRCGG